MSVWYAIPSARPIEEAEKCIREWRDRGYKIALWRDEQDHRPFQALCNFSMGSGLAYPGYARAVNSLVALILRYSSATGDPAEWIVTGGDDVLPDPKHSAQCIAEQCSEHFWKRHIMGHSNEGELLRLRTLGVMQPTNTEPLWKYIKGQVMEQERLLPLRTFGVMQPTGDRWHAGKGGFSNAPIDRVCGSPWMGAEFCRRINQGKGPLWPEYEHMYVDEELQGVAVKHGLLWQRPDITQRHQHWGRGATDGAILNDPVIPEHLQKWNTDEHWRKAKGIFESRKAAGFPGSEPIA